MKSESWSADIIRDLILMRVEGSDNLECMLSGGSATSRELDQEWMQDFKTEKSRKSGHGREGSVVTQSVRFNMDKDGILTSSGEVGFTNSSNSRRNTVMCFAVTVSDEVKGTDNGECEKAFWYEQMNARSSRTDRKWDVTLCNP